MLFKLQKKENPESGGEKSRRRFPFRPLDIIIIAAVTIISLFAPLLFSGKQGDTVIVTWHGEQIYRGALDEDAVIITPDKLNTIIVENGHAYMSEADCRDGLCLHAGFASAVHPIVCLPNGVTITVIGAEEVDGVSW